MCNKFVYKHSERLEYAKNYPTFKKLTSFTDK